VGYPKKEGLMGRKDNSSRCKEKCPSCENQCTWNIYKHQEDRENRIIVVHSCEKWHNWDRTGIITNDV